MYENVIDKALDKFGGKAHTLAEIIRKDLKKYHGIMSEAIQNENFEDALISAHSCKSICSVINVSDALEIMQQMEEKAHEKDLPSYTALFEEFSPIYVQLNEHLESITREN